MNVNYYGSLALAMADINGGTTANALVDSSNAVVRVDMEDTGAITVSLLANDSHDAMITVEKNLVLELGDKVLSFTEEGCLNLMAGTDVTINGGTLLRVMNDGADSLYLVQTAGKLKINGGSYQISGYHPNGFMAVKAANTSALLEICNAEVSAINGENEVGTGVKAIQTQAVQTHIKGATVTADADILSQAVFGVGRILIKDSTVNANSRRDNSQAVCIPEVNVERVLTIEGSTLNAQSDVLGVHAVYIGGGTASIKGSALNACSHSSYATSLELEAGTTTVEDCRIYAITYSDEDASSSGIENHAGSTIRVKNTTILADAKGDDAIKHPISVAFGNHGTAYVENVTLNGTHSGLSNHGKLYVNGGTYTGYCHGGFYFAHGADGEAFINDAIIRGGHYEGIFDFSSHSGDRYGALYIGGGSGPESSNVTTYLDGCTFDTSDCHRAIIIRGSGNEQNNTIYISNSYLEDGILNEGAIRIDNASHKLYIGAGTNITAASFKNTFLIPDGSGNFPQYPADYIEEGCAVFTDELYRRQPDGYVCSAVNKTFKRPENGKVEIFLYVPPACGVDSSKVAFKLGGMTLFEGSLVSDSSNCGTAFVEYYVKKNSSSNAVHYITNGAGLVDLHASGLVPNDVVDSIAVIALDGAVFPEGTRMYVTVKEI